jgi:hypothetical protein
LILCGGERQGIMTNKVLYVYESEENESGGKVAGDILCGIFYSMILIVGIVSLVKDFMR